ncbi:TetR/AcrR family transcriptional regulator [Rhodococcus daqingensis]|uniref:TetR/AcrR family transcriptional regulator n=1 Tax=Rhodococcus daqingensis TaxID=2479363 RepID=A0ABW2RSD3_9NOCA
MAGRKQFDVETALDQAMKVFWERGYSETSLDLLSEATGLGRGSIYGTFGDKDELFQRALDRYATIFGAQYESALAAHPTDPAAAIAAFFDVVLARIADPTLPGGCLVALSAANASSLSLGARSKVAQLLERQRQRVQASLIGGSRDATGYEDLARFVVATNQALAVMNRAGATDGELRGIAATAVTAVAASLGTST